MKSLKIYIISGAVAVLVLVVVAIFVMKSGSPASPQQTAQMTNPESTPGADTASNNPSSNQVAPAPKGGQQSVTPIKTNVGSVAGVDLSGLANEANQSASASTQDGSSDAQAISSDGQTINSSTDAVNNPIQ